MTDTKRRTVKVVTYIVTEVDVDAYNAEYGTDFSPAQVAYDAQQSFYNVAMQATFPQEANDRIIVSSELRYARAIPKAAAR